MSRGRPLGRHRGRWRLAGRHPSLAPRPGRPGAGTFGWVAGWLVMLPVFAMGGAVMYGAGLLVRLLLVGFDPASGPGWAAVMWLALGIHSTVATFRARAAARRAG